jgi:hypothetical protein
MGRAWVGNHASRVDSSQTQQPLLIRLQGQSPRLTAEWYEQVYGGALSWCPTGSATPHPPTPHMPHFRVNRNHTHPSKRQQARFAWQGSPSTCTCMHKACTWHAQGMYMACTWVISLGGDTSYTQGHPIAHAKQDQQSHRPHIHTPDQCVTTPQSTLYKRTTWLQSWRQCSVPLSQHPVALRITSSYIPAKHGDGVTRCMTPVWFIPSLLQFIRQCSNFRRRS